MYIYVHCFIYIGSIGSLTPVKNLNSPDKKSFFSHEKNENYESTENLNSLKKSKKRMSDLSMDNTEGMEGTCDVVYKDYSQINENIDINDINNEKTQKNENENTVFQVNNTPDRSNKSQISSLLSPKISNENRDRKNSHERKKSFEKKLITSKNQNSNSKKSLKSIESPFGDFRVFYPSTVPGSDDGPSPPFLSPHTKSPNNFNNISNVIIPSIYTDITLNDFYKNMKNDEYTNKNENDENFKISPKNSKNLNKNVICGVVSGDFRYVKRPIWLSLSKTPPHKKKHKNDNNEDKYYPNPSYSTSKIP